MTTLAPELGHRRGRVPRAVIVTIAVAWGLAFFAYASGRERQLHHDALIEHGPPLWAAAIIFAVAWQAMIAAMMLPSALPLIRLFWATAQRQERTGRVTAAFVGGYAAVWTGFGIAAFFGDVTIHRTVDATPWLAARPWLIGGGTLALAGAFQFSGLKDRCLSKCRHPAPYLLAHYRRGAAGAFRLGSGHGLFCLGCCWALMLVMFGAGVAVLWWMAALSALMVYEKVGRHGEKLVPIAGAVLFGAAALVLAHPPWLPNLLAA
jgi:predicted metal-binding membrane protein